LHIELYCLYINCVICIVITSPPLWSSHDAFCSYISNCIFFMHHLQQHKWVSMKNEWRGKHLYKTGWEFLVNTITQVITTYLYKFLISLPDIKQIYICCLLIASLKMIRKSAYTWLVETCVIIILLTVILLHIYYCQWQK